MLRLAALLASLQILPCVAGQESRPVAEQRPRFSRRPSAQHQALASILYAMSPGARVNSASVRSFTRSARRHAPVMESSEAGEFEATKPVELLQQGREEKDEQFEAEVAEEAKQKRSKENIAAQRELAEIAVKALQGDEKVVAALEKHTKSTGKVAKALKSKVKGTSRVVGEAVKFGAISFGGFDLEDPAFLSREFREGGCDVAMVGVDYDFALGPDALKETVAEQDLHKGEFPGPIPVIARVPAIDPLQLAKAALDGASGIVLSLSIAGEEKTRELMEVAERLGLEVLLRVTSSEQVATALELGAKMIVFGDMTLSEATGLKGTLTKDVVSVCDIPYDDVRGAWMIRDAGFDALVTGLSLSKMVARDRIAPAASIKAMRSKGSVKYGLGYTKGRMEGAKESLGSLAM